MTTRRDADGGQLRRRRRQSKQASKHHPSPPSVPSLPIYHSAQSAQASLRYELFYEDGSDEDDDDDNSSDDAHCPRRPASSHPLRLLSNQSAALASCGPLSLSFPPLSPLFAPFIMGQTLSEPVTTKVSLRRRNRGCMRPRSRPPRSSPSRKRPLVRMKPWHGPSATCKDGEHTDAARYYEDRDANPDPPSPRLAAPRRRRISMEDAHQMILDLDGNSKQDEKTALFAVFDGHGGERAPSVFHSHRS